MFDNRIDAGKRLAERLVELGVNGDITVCIPRGGVIVGEQVARRLGTDLTLIMAKKIGAPGFPEVAIGAVGPDGSLVVDDNGLRRTDCSQDYLEGQVALVKKEVNRRLVEYGMQPQEDYYKGKAVVVVDDGIATGFTVKATIKTLREWGVSRLVLAVPLCALETAQELEKEVDLLVSLILPEPFYSVGMYYTSFEQNNDDEVREVLRRFRKEN